MFERYSHAARRAVFFARYEASEYGSPAIETEHLLLGILREDKSLAKKAFARPGALELLRKEIEAQITRRDRIPHTVEIPLSPDSKRVLNLAAESAQKLSQDKIDSVHLLLGILRAEGCLAERVLRHFQISQQLSEDEAKSRAKKDFATSEAVIEVTRPDPWPSLPATLEEFLAAWKARDFQAVFGFFEGESQFWDARGNLHVGNGIRSALKDHLGECEIKSVELINQLPVSDDAASVTIAYSKSGPDVAAGAENFHLVLTLCCIDREWVLLAAHILKL